MIEPFFKNATKIHVHKNSLQRQTKQNEEVIR